MNAGLHGLQERELPRHRVLTSSEVPARGVLPASSGIESEIFSFLPE